MSTFNENSAQIVFKELIIRFNTLGSEWETNGLCLPIGINRYTGAFQMALIIGAPLFKTTSHFPVRRSSS